MIENVRSEFEKWKNKAPQAIQTLAQAGSNRRYFRVFEDEARSYIATYNPDNITENQSFIYLSAHFHAKGLNVPEVLYVAENQEIYFQSDAGPTALMDLLKQQGNSTEVCELFCQAVRQLVALQVKGNEGLDYSRCLSKGGFDAAAIAYDLYYFLFYFVQPLNLPYDRALLWEEIGRLAASLAADPQQFFMYRDFQSRNIMVQDGKLCFIDFQGGMSGPMAYDLVSLIWQARAQLPEAWKELLLDIYVEEAKKNVGAGFDEAVFRQNYPKFVLIRLLQTLGSYGYRGLFERRTYFLSAIPYALNQLERFVGGQHFYAEYPVLSLLCLQVSAAEIRQKFEFPTAEADSPLHLKIQSFSYKKGIPQDESSNGGGFVFDCRSLHNPGRYAPYVDLTGRDESVKNFLLTESKMNEFLAGVFRILDIAVENYLTRGFDSLMVSFGCTGGKHRSVFAADATAKYLLDKYKVKITLTHIERNWEPERFGYTSTPNP